MNLEPSMKVAEAGAAAAAIGLRLVWDNRAGHVAAVQNTVAERIVDAAARISDLLPPDQQDAAIDRAVLVIQNGGTVASAVAAAVGKDWL